LKGFESLYSDHLLTGKSLPEGTLCVTFDDGPGQTVATGAGPQSLDLAKYLCDEGIPATFFVVGRHVREYPDIVPAIRALGHTIGNHTFDHPNLPDFLRAGGDVADQITRTDTLIREAVGLSPIYLRPPFGAWDASVAKVLNAKSGGHLGPVGWDIDGRDWEFWRDGKSPADCAENYLRKIDGAKRGIVLAHDSILGMQLVREHNQTYEMIRLLIPRLKSRGYRFCRLDEVPGVAELLPSVEG
jgi:peptidoglycan/xylan/chitin deacetylase (PgdA/CDA1 family)